MEALLDDERRAREALEKRMKEEKQAREKLQEEMARKWKKLAKDLVATSRQISATVLSIHHMVEDPSTSLG